MVRSVLKIVVSGLFCCMFLAQAAIGSTDEIYKTTIGDVSVTAIMDTSFEFTSAYLKNPDSTILKEHLPDGKYMLPVNAYIVKTKKQTILIDAGTGTRLLSNMKEAGFSPENINLVLITHGHFDHVGGLLKDGKPVFPNAKILMSENEMRQCGDSSIAQLPADLKPFFMHGNQVLKVYGKRVVTFKDGAKINDCISSVDIKGHTAGQTAYLIDSKGKKLLIAGDFLHMAPLQIPHPECCFVFDADQSMAASARKQVIDNVSKENMLVAGTHIKFPGIGSIKDGVLLTN